MKPDCQNSQPRLIHTSLYTLSLLTCAKLYTNRLLSLLQRSSSNCLDSTRLGLVGRDKRCKHPHRLLIGRTPKPEVDAVDKFRSRNQKRILVDPEGIRTRLSIKSKYSLLFTIHLIATHSDLVVYSRTSHMMHSNKLSTYSLSSIPRLLMRYNTTRGTKNLLIEPGTRSCRRIFSST